MEIYVTAALTLFALLAAVEAVVIVRLSTALQTVGRFGERLAHLAAALELLTDTTEVGFANVAVELDRTAPKRTARTSRGTTARRITQAVQHGQSIEDVAAAEALSQSEVRLHLEFASPDLIAAGGNHGTVRG
jgi:ABC-type transport system involved in cytochrome bd biosynthesis fused ATPase/permease subunit